MAFKRYFYYHPESDSLWGQTEPFDLEKSDGLVEEISYEEYLKLELKLKQKEVKTMPLQDTDYSKVQPQQPGGMGGHPPGIWDAQISNTYLKPSKNNQHLLLYVEFTTPVSRIEENFIVDGPSTQAIEIAQKQISALCHATSVFRLSYPKHPDGSPVMDQPARELRGAILKIEIAPQKQKNDKGELVETGYMEIKKYFDKAGNEPGKTGSAPATQPANNAGWGGQQQQPQQSAPMTQQPGGWGNPASQQPAPNPAPGSGWQPGGGAAPSGGPAPWNK